MKSFIGLVIGLVLSASLNAGDALSVAFQSGVWTKYVDTDGFVYDDKAVLQSEVTVSGAGGFYAGVWHSVGKNIYARELDLSIGFAHEGIVNIDVGYTYEDYYRFFRGRSGDVHTLFARFSKEFARQEYWSVAPMIELERYKPGKGSAFEGGFRARFGAAYSRQMLSAQLVGETAIVRDDGTYGSLPAWVVNQSLGLEWKVGKFTIGLPMWAYYAPISKHSGRASNSVFGATAKFEY